MHRRSFLQASLLAGLWSLLPTAGAAAPRTWLYVDTERRSVTLFEGYRDPRPLRHFEPGALGRNGADHYRIRGSRVTPKGRFRITGINEKSRFHRFFAFDYPTVEQARWGLERGVITRREHRAIVAAHRRGDPPPQNTALGGHIGLHGVKGKRSTAWNWTEGCVALMNDQIDILTPWLGVGTHVVVV